MTLFGSAAIVSGLLFLIMLAGLEIGFRVGHRHAQDNPRFHDGIGPIDAAIFALLGLLLGFAFAGATARLDARRQLIVREANAIGTAYLRLDLLPADAQPPLRQTFRRYLEARRRAYSQDNLTSMLSSIEEGAQLQGDIWTRIVSVGRQDSSQNTSRLVAPAINEMIDVSTARAVALRTHLPTLILVLLIAVAIASSLVAGYAMANRTHRSLLHGVLYAAIVSVTVYTVLDLDDPRIGLIRLDATEQILQQLSDSIR